MKSQTVWKCGGCQEHVIAEQLQPEVDADGCYFICPECDARNPLINVARDFGGKPGDIWLVQPSIFGQRLKPGQK